MIPLSQHVLHLNLHVRLEMHSLNSYFKNSLESYWNFQKEFQEQHNIPEWRGCYSIFVNFIYHKILFFYTK